MKSDAARMALTVVAGVLVVTALALIGLAVTYPETVRQTSLGAEFFLADLSSTGSGLLAVTGFKPLADALLLAGSYVLVCLIVWGQMKLRDYLKARGHLN
ncbi:MAG: hypothetical protein Q8Q11_02200 [bacterium]|nr:hypothetical protein [bacterium]MDZ4248002.1 hypothetical protein [Patescibacteria group bacterium]